MENYKFKVYIVEKNPGSQDFISKIKSIFNSAIKNKYSLEIVDILSHPEIAVRDNVLASPTLILESPGPSRRVIGKITDENRLLSMLNLSVGENN